MSEKNQVLAFFAGAGAVFDLEFAHVFNPCQCKCRVPYVFESVAIQAQQLKKGVSQVIPGIKADTYS